MFDFITNIHFLEFVVGAVFGACARWLVSYKRAEKQGLHHTRMRQQLEYALAEAEKEIARLNKLFDRFGRELQMRRLLDDSVEDRPHE